MQIVSVAKWHGSQIAEVAQGIGQHVWVLLKDLASSSQAITLAQVCLLPPYQLKLTECAPICVCVLCLCVCVLACACAWQFSEPQPVCMPLTTPIVTKVLVFGCTTDCHGCGQWGHAAFAMLPANKQHAPLCRHVKSPLACCIKPFRLGSTPAVASGLIPMPGGHVMLHLRHQSHPVHTKASHPRTHDSHMHTLHTTAFLTTQCCSSVHSIRVGSGIVQDPNMFSHNQQLKRADLRLLAQAPALFLDCKDPVQLMVALSGGPSPPPAAPAAAAVRSARSVTKTPVQLLTRLGSQPSPPPDGCHILLL